MLLFALFKSVGTDLSYTQNTVQSTTIMFALVVEYIMKKLGNCLAKAMAQRFEYCG